MKIQKDWLKEKKWNRELPEEYPCGILRCTYEKYPKGIYANRWMFRFWGTSEEKDDWQNFFRQNIYFMLPFEDRELFRGYLEMAEKTTEPVSVEHQVINCSGGCTRLIGWLRIVENAKREKEYQFLYMQAPDARGPAERKREKAYREILEQSYDMIFEIDHQENALECIYKKESLNFWFVNSARFMISDMVKQSFLGFVHQEDREQVEDCMNRVLSTEQNPDASRGFSLQFRVCQGPHTRVYHVTGIRLDDRVTLLCGRDLSDDTMEKGGLSQGRGAGLLRPMQVCVNAMKEGYMPEEMVFRLSNDLVYPLSSKTNICRFCDCSEEEYVRAREIGMSMEEFLRRSHIAWGECWQALQKGETVMKGAVEDAVLQRYLYIVDDSKQQGKETEYILLLIYIVLDDPFAGQKPRVRICTFGHFDVFVDEKPVIFRSEKSKEMLAVLVDRGGGFVTNPYVISCLWENEPYDQRLQNRCRQTAHRMMETLKQYGIEDIIERADGRRRIIPEKVSCDFFNHKMGKEIPGQGFHGAYMSDYSWSEITLSGLLKEQEHLRPGDGKSTEFPTEKVGEKA